MTTTTNGNLEVRFAHSRRDIKAAQLLRYRIFYKEMGASANLRTRLLRRDVDHFDRACDHLLVIDRRRALRPVTAGAVVGTCRLIRRAVADERGGFYSAGEFDLAPLVRGPGECVEVASNVPGVIGVRDSKNPTGPALVLTPGEWSTFLSGVKGGTLGA